MNARPLKPQLADLVPAAKEGNVEVVKAILKHFPTKVDQSLQGVTALQEASRKGHLDVIKILAAKDADLDCADEGYNTPLHFAIKGDQPFAVDLLIKLGARVEEKNLDEETPAMMAFRLNYSECLQKFLERNPNMAITNPLQKAKPKIRDDNIDSCEDVDEAPVKQVKMCAFCEDQPAAVNFEPCGHTVACFLCSFRNAACKECGTAVEKISFTKTQEVDRCMRNIKKMKTEIEELTAMHTCPICWERPIECNMRCGHMFCKICIHQFKNRERVEGQPFKCPYCKEPSRYFKLYPQWSKDYKGPDTSNAGHSSKRASGPPEL